MRVRLVVTHIELEELRRLENMERKRIRAEAAEFSKRTKVDPEYYIKGATNLFTKDNNVDINKEVSDVQYFRGENLLEKINNQEVLFNLAISGQEDTTSIDYLSFIEIKDGERKEEGNEKKETDGNESIEKKNLSQIQTRKVSANVYKDDDKEDNIYENV